MLRRPPISTRTYTLVPDPALCRSRVDVREGDAGVGAHEAVLGLADDEGAAAAHDPHRLGLDDGLVAARVVGVDAHHGVLGLRHHLLRHDHDVAVAQVGLGGGDEPGEVVARSHLGDALDGEDLETCAHAASTAVARAAAVAGSRMIGGTTPQRTPPPPPPPAPSSSASSTPRVPASGAASRATPTPEPP